MPIEQVLGGNPLSPAIKKPAAPRTKRYNGTSCGRLSLLALELALKQRLLGAVLLILLGVLVIPMLLDTQRPDLVRPMQEVSEPRELVFTHQTFPADLNAPEAQAMPGPDAGEPIALEPREKWYVQVGRFRNTTKAAEIRDTMREAGYPTNLFSQEAADGKTHQRIWVGPYYTQQDAEHVLEGIKAKKNLTDVHQGWVVRQP